MMMPIVVLLVGCTAAAPKPYIDDMSESISTSEGLPPLGGRGIGGCQASARCHA